MKPFYPQYMVDEGTRFYVSQASYNENMRTTYMIEASFEQHIPTSTPSKIDRAAIHEKIGVIMQGMIAAENLNPTKFANILGVPPSNFYGLATGKGKISVTLLQEWMPLFKKHFSKAWEGYGREYTYWCNLLPEPSSRTRTKIEPPPVGTFAALLFNAMRFEQLEDSVALRVAEKKLGIERSTLVRFLNGKHKPTREYLERYGWPETFLKAYPEYASGQKRKNFDVIFDNLPCTQSQALTYKVGSFAHLLEGLGIRQIKSLLDAGEGTITPLLRGEKQPCAWDVYVKRWPQKLAQAVPDKWERYGYLFLIQIGTPVPPKYTRYSLPEDCAKTSIREAWRSAASAFMRDYIDALYGKDPSVLRRKMVDDDLNNQDIFQKILNGKHADFELYEAVVRETCWIDGLLTCNSHNPIGPQATDRRYSFAVRGQQILNHAPLSPLAYGR